MDCLFCKIKNKEIEAKILYEDDDFLVEKNHTGLKVFFLILGLILLAGVIYLALTKYVL